MSNSHLENSHLNYGEHYQMLVNHHNKEIKELMQVQRHPIMYSNPGYILRIKIEGFLTHKNKTIDFEKPITLIHGPNGSGKSSILQAIHFVLLGDKTKIRENVNNYGQFKLEGKVIGENQTSKVSVTYITIYFNQPCAIRRKIEINNQTTFQYTNFSSQQAKWEQIKQSDVNIILNELKHFPNNRVTMITQADMKIQSRMNASERFILFSQCSMLQEIIDSNQQTLQTAQQLKQDLLQLDSLKNEKRKERKVLQQKMTELEQIKDYLVKSAGFQLKQEAMQCMLQYINNQKNQAIVQQSYLQLQQQIQNLNDTKQIMGNQNEQYVIEQQQLQKIQQYYRQQLEKRETANEQFQKVKNNAEQKFVDITHKTNQIQQNQNREKDLALKIQRNQQLIQTHENLGIFEFAEQKPENPCQLAELNNNINVLSNTQDENDQKIKTLQNQQSQLNFEIDKFKQRTGAINAAIERCELQIQQNKLKQTNMRNGVARNTQHKNSLNNKDKQMFESLQKQFKNNITGPASFYVSIKEDYENLNDVIQRFIRPKDLNFVVYLKSNEQTIFRQLDQIPEYYKKIMLKQNLQSQNISQKIEQYQQKLKFKIVPLIECLDFQSDLVKSVLVIKKHIDRVVIVNDVRDGRELLKLDPQLQVLPINQTSILTITHQGNYSGMPLKSEHQQEGYGQSALYCHTKKSTVQLQLEEQQFEALLLQKQDELQQHQNNNQQIIVNNDKIQQNQKQIEVLAKEQDKISIEKTQYQKSLNQIQQEYENLMKQYLKRKNDFDNIQSQFKNAKQDIISYQNSIQLIKDNNQQQNDLIDELKQGLQQLQIEQNEFKVSLENIQQQLALIKQQENNQQQKIINMSISQLQNKIQKLKSEVQNLQSDYDIENQKQQLLETNYLKYQQQIYLTARQSVSELLKSFPEMYEQITKSGENQLQLIQSISEVGDLQNNQEIETKLKERIEVMQKEIAKYYELYNKYNANQAEDYVTVSNQFTKTHRDYSDVKQSYENAIFQYEQIIQLTAQQMVRISLLRMRCEQEVITFFQLQTQNLNIQMNLQFIMPKLPTLSMYGFKSAILPDQIKQDYEQQLGDESRNNRLPAEGSIEISAEKREIKTLSGGESTFTALAFITACCRVIQSSYLQIDEWDVFLDPSRRTAAFRMLMEVIMHSTLQCVFVTPNDVDLMDAGLNDAVRDLIGVVRLEGIARD